MDSIDELIRNAPLADTDEERENREFMENLHAFRVSVHDEFPEEEYTLAVDNVGFFAKGDIHAIKAKQKQGKTTSIYIMIASLLCGRWGRISSVLKMPKILVIDTEQKASDVQLVYKRAFQLAGLPEEDIHDRFQVYHLRSMSKEDKQKAVQALAKEFQPDIIFIDGIVDLMDNFNDVQTSQDILEILMRLSTKEVSGCEIAIVCVLHTNKATDDHNMRGHAGTMLAQRAGTVLEVSKKNGIFTITNSDARHKEVPDWSYRFDDKGNVVDADEERQRYFEQETARKQADQQKRSENTKEERIKILKNVIREAKTIGGINRPNLRNKLESRLNLGSSSVDTLIRKCIDDDIIRCTNSKTLVVTEDIKNDGVQQEMLF